MCCTGSIFSLYVKFAAKSSRIVSTYCEIYSPQQQSVYMFNVPGSLVENPLCARPKHFRNYEESSRHEHDENDIGKSCTVAEPERENAILGQVGRREARRRECRSLPAFPILILSRLTYSGPTAALAKFL